MVEGSKEITNSNYKKPLTCRTLKLENTLRIISLPIFVLGSIFMVTSLRM